MTDYAHPKTRKALFIGVLIGVGISVIFAFGAFVYSYRVALVRAVQYKTVVEQTDEKLFKEAAITKFEVKK